LYSTKKLKERNLYTNITEKAIAKVNVTKHRHFKRTAWDPRMNNKSNFNNFSVEKSELDESIENDLISFIKDSKSSSVNKETCSTIDDQDTELIKDLSLQLLDQVLNNIANPICKDSTQPKKDLDWEFMIANTLQTELPLT
jgi:hypothetical protein